MSGPTERPNRQARARAAAVQDAVDTAAPPAAMPPLPLALPEGASASVRELAFAAQQYAKVR